MTRRHAESTSLNPVESIRGKRFLITQSALRLFAGSELVAVELAEFLQAQGASVLLYACFVGDPIERVIREKNLRVVTDDEQLRLDDFDFVWVHHQVLPVSFLAQLQETDRRRVPRFIFLHMSGLETHLLEQPYVWELEQRLSSKTLFVSTEARDCLSRVCLDVDSLAGGGALFRNPAPTEFSQAEHVPRLTPGRFLIVSNHLPAELMVVKELLRVAGREVVSVGEGQEQYRTIEPQFLQEFDVVITIGKTVQYCLCANVPVYVYDRFGGHGFLSAMNEQAAAATNFSGRGGEKKTAEEIFEEIVGRYGDAVEYQTAHRARFISELSIDRVLPELLRSVVAEAPRRLDEPRFYSHYLRSVLVMMKWKFIHENELALCEMARDRLNRERLQQSGELESAVARRDESERAIAETHTQLDAQRRELEALNAALREARDAVETERRGRELLEREVKELLESASWQATLRLRSAASLMPDGLKSRLKHLLSRRR